MIPSLIRIQSSRGLLQASVKMMENRRMKIYYRSGALKPMPVINTFGVLGVLGTVIPGLLIGACKN